MYYLGLYILVVSLEYSNERLSTIFFRNLIQIVINKSVGLVTDFIVH